ncbi:GNAT family N-acetyltransferase [Streptomyces sp. NPDC058947]|uniref:GNAT family N-acetyltransferase n=1 Tax=Streptomyces sp. NPDC058947 TaxID=3346675 RepID=UPI0036B0F7EA
MAVTVTDNPSAARFELHEDQKLAGFAQYHTYKDEIAFLHTEVDPRFGGRGHAGRLIGAALDAARERGLAVLPYCPFVRGYITRHPDYLDLVPQGDRARFGL